MDNELQKQINDKSIAYPSGKQFLELFSKEADVKNLPYMHVDSLNKDVVLHYAMLIILSKRLGMLEERISIDNLSDDVSSDKRDQILKMMKHAFVSTERFMQGSAMISLRDNEYSGKHENQSRLECYKFLLR